MTQILFWGKPKKKQPVEEWKLQSFDSGPAGGYIPNMSEDDAQKWRAKLVGTRSGAPQVEIRRMKDAVNMVVVVAGSKGYKGKHRFIEEPHAVQISLNSPMVFTPDEFRELDRAVTEAHVVLADYEENPKATMNRIKGLQDA